MKCIILDSTPLGLITQRPNATEADACRNWLAERTARGLRVMVPEIVDYELRRELIRSGKTASVQRLDRFITHPTVTFLPITSPAIRLAAELWAKARQRGMPTAESHALDIDVILSAQVLVAQFQPGEYIVATSNVSHVSLFVPADVWSNIH